MAEKSTCISIPSVKMHLLGMKHMQKLIMEDQFIKDMKMDILEIETLRRFSTDIKHIMYDCEMDKNKFLDIVENNPEE